MKIGSPARASATDAELVRLTQRGDKASFDLLVQKYQNKLLHLVSRYVKDPDTALDVVQDAFIKAYRGLATFRGDCAFYTWIYRIAINTAKNHLVSEGRRQPEVELDAPDTEIYHADAQHLRDDATPERVLLTEEIKLKIHAVIESLPEDLKMAIILRELEGLSYEEIAETMNCPIGTVRSRIFRAREAIDRVLEPLLN